MFSRGPMFEPASHGYWESVYSKDGGHYNNYGLAVNGWTRDDLGMDALRDMFPDGKANEMNFVLFSTSGVHGTYATIEREENPDEERLSEWEDAHPGEPYKAHITFLIVHPRVCTLRHGNCEPKTPDDFAFLKRLRQTSWDAVLKIGAPEQE